MGRRIQSLQDRRKSFLTSVPQSGAGAAAVSRERGRAESERRSVRLSWRGASGQTDRRARRGGGGGRRAPPRGCAPGRAGEERLPGAFPAPRSIVPRPHVGGRRTQRITATGMKARRAPSGARSVPPGVPRTPLGEVGAPPPGAEQQERGEGRSPERGDRDGGERSVGAPAPPPAPPSARSPRRRAVGGGPGAGLGRGARPMGTGGSGGRRGRPRPSGGAQPMGGGGGAGRPRVPSRWAPPPRGPGGRGRRAAPEAQK